MEETTYNGWKNRETWLIYVYITNTDWLYRDVRRELTEGADAEGLRELFESVFSEYIYAGASDEMNSMLYDFLIEVTGDADWVGIHGSLCEDFGIGDDDDDDDDDDDGEEDD